MNLSPSDFEIERLEGQLYDNPLDLRESSFVEDGDRVIYSSVIRQDEEDPYEDLSFHMAGPRRKLHFNPAKINVGIVTCGGLCPGLNDVIRAITTTCLKYGVKNVYGFRHGYKGLSNEHSHTRMILTHEMVDSIHQDGGTILSSSRGPQDPSDIVDTLVKFNVSILFLIGGDGTQTGGIEIAKEITKRGLDISVVGIPKTIDNDVMFVKKTFGFQSAVEMARQAVVAAHVEAKGTLNGVGIVKLMGRESGFIPAQASLSSDANICLIPEVPLVLDELLEKIRKRFQKKDHIVIVVGEGVGQDLLQGEGQEERDASGNKKLKDIGLFLKEQIGAYLKEVGIQSSIKYIDPSYMIRSIPANASDSSFCLRLGAHAVHAGMAGYTKLIIGFWNEYYTHVPTRLAVMSRKKVDLKSALWQGVLEATM